MRRRNSASFPTQTYAAGDTATVSWGYFVLTVICSCVLAAGFFLAAKQHFNTMDYGMRNSKLRKQVEELQTEQRRLMLAREISLSPTEIKRVAGTLVLGPAGKLRWFKQRSPSPILLAPPQKPRPQRRTTAVLMY